MRMQPALEFFTADMVRALPEDGNRYETVHGELLVTPSPRALHQEVLFRLAHALQCYLDEQPGVAHIFLSPADIFVGPRHFGTTGRVRSACGAGEYARLEAGNDVVSCDRGT